MAEDVTPNGLKCPECGKGELVTQTRTEEFDFDFGEEPLRVRAENVPVEICDQCGEVMSGPNAAKVRHDALLKLNPVREGAAETTVAVNL